MATEMLSKAAEVASNSPIVQEAFGDEYKAKGEIARARDSYLLAHRLNPNDANLERKYAELVLRSNSNINVEEMLKSGNVDSLLMGEGESYAKPGAAAFLSLMLPGTGQFVRGKNGLAIGLLCGWLLMLLLGARPADFVHLIQGKFSLHVLWMLIALAIHGYSVAENLITKAQPRHPLSF